MQIGFWFSGGSPLMVGLERGLQSLNHNVMTAHANGEYDLLVVFNQVSHVTNYSYPEWPRRQCPVVFVDAAEFGYYKRLPQTAACYANTFTQAAMEHDTKNYHQQSLLKRYLENRSFPYMLREFSKFVSYPQGYWPVDYPLYLHSECDQKPDREEYLRRHLDLYLSWGGSHPWRLPITQALRECPVHSEIYVIEQDGPRVEQSIYFHKMRNARVGVSFDGYGSSSFRLTEVLVRSMALVGPLFIHRYAPLVDGETCIEFHIDHSGEEFLSTDVCERMQECAQDPARCFEIYERGFDHCWQYYSEKATAEYLLKVVEAHDYSQPTPLEIV